MDLGLRVCLKHLNRIFAHSNSIIAVRKGHDEETFSTKISLAPYYLTYRDPAFSSSSVLVPIRVQYGTGVISDDDMCCWTGHLTYHFRQLLLEDRRLPRESVGGVQQADQYGLYGIHAI